MRYVVVRCGACDQGVIDGTERLSLAKTLAERAAEREEDMYHNFEIRTWSKSTKEFSVVRHVLADEGGGVRVWTRVA